MTIRIGADPELFVFDKTTHLPVSAHDLIPGTKDDPFPIRKNGAIQVDGVAAEFNIEPATNENDFITNIHIVKGALWREIKTKNPNYILKAEPAIVFTHKQWKKIPEFAKQLGCTPDYNAYTLEKNPPPDSSKLMRTGSGHLHVSWKDEEEEVTDGYIEHVAALVRHFDAHLLPESRKWDTDTKRASLYGAPGAFRPKSYGVEYRVLSNKWLDNTKSQAYVFNAAKYITEKWLKNYSPEQYTIPSYV
jgi:hypothetical protein